MADAPDSKSGMGNSMCGFDPRLRYLKKHSKNIDRSDFQATGRHFWKSSERRQNL